MSTRPGVLRFRSSQTRLRHNDANFGIGTLAFPGAPLLPTLPQVPVDARRRSAWHRPTLDAVGQGERVFMPPYLILIRTARRHCLAKVLAPRRAAAWGGRTGETTMAKVVDDVARGDEPARLALSPSVRPCPLALADRDRRAELEPRDLTAWFFGDPLPGMSALDRRNRNERTH